MPKKTKKLMKSAEKPQSVKKKSKPQWDDRYYVKAHELARSGLADSEVGDALGLHPFTWKKWVGEREALREALATGRSPSGGGQGYSEYVYGRLPARLQEVWDDLAVNDKAGRAVEFIDDALDGLAEKDLQMLWLHALVAKNFNPQEAHRAVNVTERRVAGWLSHDPGFAEIVARVKTMRKDFCEGALMDLVARGDTAAVIFVNRTLNRDRGYDPKVTVDHNHTVTGGVLHATVDLKDLDALPAAEKRKILEAIRSGRERKALGAKAEVVAADALPGDGDEVVSENLLGDDE